jgi:hypothetical protein
VRKFKIWIILLSVVALVGGLPLAQALAADTATRLTPATQTISVGETTTVALYVQDVDNLFGYQVEIAFDPAVLEVVDADGATEGVQVVLGSWLQADFVYQNSADNDLGTIGCVLSQLFPRPPISGSGELLTITFRGVAEGDSAVRFTDLTLASIDGMVIPTSQQNAQIDVQTTTPPTPTPTPTVPPPEPTLRLQTTDAGAETVAEVWVEDVANFYGVEFDLAFDEAIVRGVSVVEGPAFTDYPDQYDVTQNNISDGVVQFAATLLRVAKAPPLDGDLHLATIAFAHVNCGTSALTWDETKLSDSDGDPISHTARGGSITVEVCRGEVIGQAFMEGRTDHGGIEVSLVDGGSESTLTASDGEYTFTGVPADVYDLVMSHDLYLTATIRSCPVQAGEVAWMPDVELLGGDLTGDGVINIGDLTRGGSVFNSQDPGADINADGFVDIFDIVLIGKNFGRTGPVILTCGS